MNTEFFFRPAAVILAPLILGIAAGNWFEGHQPWSVATLLLCLGYMGYALAKKQKLLISPLLFFLSLGYLSIQPWISPSISEHHISHYATGSRWNITGTVSNDPITTQNGRTRFILMVDRLQKDHESAIFVMGKLRVTCAGDPLPNIGPDDRISFKGKIRTVRNFKNPGGFDYERYMAFQAIHATTYVSSPNIKFIDKTLSNGTGNWISDTRAMIAGIIQASQTNKSSEAIMKALVIGDRTGIDKDLRDAFNKAGVGHLLAISGLHVGIVASFFFFLLFRLFSLSQTFLNHAWTAKASALLSILPVTLYGFLSGMSPSTQRAVIMISAFLMTFLIKRRQDSINTMAIAALVILILFPPALFSISFQLSFSAVFAILFGFSLLKHSETKFSFHISFRKKISAFFLASFFAIMGSLPLVMHHFNQISLVGLMANFILVPLIGFLVVPAGIISAFILPVSQTLSFAGFQLAGSVLAISITIVEYIANLPFSAVKTITPSLLEIALYYLLGGFVFVLWKQRPLKKAYIIAFSALIAVAAADIAYWTNVRFFPKKLRITILDVGQGNAAIVEFPGGKTMMIDGGGFYDNNIFDVGEKITAPLLWRKKIKTVNMITLTHPDSDHMNGLLYIAQHFNVHTIKTNNEPSSSVGYQEFMDIIHKKKIRMPEFYEIPSSFEINGVKVSILYPPEDFLERKAREPWRDTNSNSMVIKLEKGNFSCLFTGDIKAKSEAELVALHRDDLKTQVLIAPHHGSKTSNTIEFLEAVDPETVIFSAGFNNRFNLPNKQVIKRYQQRDVEIFRTDYHGAVTISTDGVSTQITPFLKLLAEERGNT